MAEDPSAAASTPKPRGMGRVAFLAHKASIQTAVEAGWPLKVIYEEHADRLHITYSQFTRYVQRYITDGEPAARAATKPGRPSPQTIPVPVPRLAPPIISPAEAIEQPRFQHTALPVNKEDLI